MYILENSKLETIPMSFSTPLPLLASTGCHQYFFGSGVMVRKGKRKRRFTTCKRRRLNHRTNTDLPKERNSISLLYLNTSNISSYLNFAPSLLTQPCFQNLCWCLFRSLVNLYIFVKPEVTVYLFADKPWLIMDLAVFNGQIYVLTDCAGIGIFKLWPNPTLMLLDVKGTPSLSTSYLQLVILNEELLMLDKMHSDPLTYKLDLTNMEWVRVERLGNAALFVHKNQSAIISNPSQWGGNSSSIYYMDGKRCEKEPRVEYRSAFLYFPHRSQDKNLLQDDISGSD